MTRLPVIFRREYVERIRSRSFLFSTLLTPLLLSLVSLGPTISDRVAGDGRSYHFVVVDETEESGPRVVELLRASHERRGGRATAEGGLGPVLGTREELDARVAAEKLDGYVWIPADVADRNRFELRVTPRVPGSVQREMEAAVSSAVQFTRLRAAGVAESEVARLFQPVLPETQVVQPDGSEERSGDGGMGLGLAVGFLLYTLILLYGTQVLHSVQEEKTSRIAEVLISSVRPVELMLGKVLGVGAAALTQLAIWAVLARAAYGARGSLERIGMPTGALDFFASEMAPATIAGVGLYLVLGFLLYATLFAAVGAAAGSTEDAQRFTFPIIIPLFVPMFLGDAIITDPRGTAAVVLSWVPLTAPLVVPMRIGAQGVSPAEIVATLLVMAASVLAVGWVAGRIYRVGILMTGSRPKLRDLIQWIRMA